MNFTASISPKALILYILTLARACVCVCKTQMQHLALIHGKHICINVVFYTSAICNAHFSEKEYFNNSSVHQLACIGLFQIRPA